MAGAEKPRPRQPTFFLLGVRVDSLEFGVALGMLEGFAAHRDSLPPRTVLFARPCTIAAARRDPQLKECISRADLVLPSGACVAAGARILGTPLREELKRDQILSALLESAQRSGKTVFLVGGERERPGELRAHVYISYPRLRIVGSLDRFASSRNDDRAVKEINAANPDIVLVAMETPEAEEWIARNAPRLRAGVCIAAGGEIELLRGHLKNKPGWIGRMRIGRLLRLLRGPAAAGVRPFLHAVRFLALVAARALVPRRLRLIYHRTMALW